MGKRKIPAPVKPHYAQDVKTKLYYRIEFGKFANEMTINDLVSFKKIPKGGIRSGELRFTKNNFKIVGAFLLDLEGA